MRSQIQQKIQIFSLDRFRDVARTLTRSPQNINPFIYLKNYLIPGYLFILKIQKIQKIRIENSDREFWNFLNRFNI